MKVLNYDNNVKLLIVLPRKHPVVGDVTEVILKNELTNEIATIPHTWSVDNNCYLSVLLDDSPIYSPNSYYELTINCNGELIYKNRLVLLTSPINVQDYSTTQIDTVDNKLKF